MRLLLVLGLLCVACPHTPPATAVPSKGVGLALEEAVLPVVIVQATGPVEGKRTDPVVAGFAGAGRKAEVHALSTEDQAALLKEVRSVERAVPDADWKRLEDAKGAALLTFRWSPTDAAGLAAAYAAAAAIAEWPGTWTVAADVSRLQDAPAWKALASDAAQKPPRAPRHFLNQLFPEDDGSLTIETAGTERFALRQVAVDHLSRSNARPLGSLVNLLVQRWVEGQRPLPDGTLELAVAELVQPGAKQAALASLNKGATGKVRTRSIVTGEGTAAVAHLQFPDATGASERERQEHSLDQLFGSSDASETIDHTDELLTVSRASRERLIRELKPRVQKGLPAGEVLLVKAPFPCSQGTEWMWVDVRTWKGTKVAGALQSDPDCAKELHAGQPVEVNEGELFDYMDKSLDGSFVGNDTGKLRQPELFEELDGGRRRIRE